MPTHTYSTDAHRRSVAKYTSAHRTVKTLGLYDTTDADIIAHLATKDNVQGYIKALIRADMAREEKKEEES